MSDPCSEPHARFPRAVSIHHRSRAFRRRAEERPGAADRRRVVRCVIPLRFASRGSCFFFLVCLLLLLLLFSFPVSLQPHNLRPRASLDEILGGGVRVGHVTELHGESGAGKSALAMSIAARAALAGYSVVFVDTSAAFSAELCANVAQAAVFESHTGGAAQSSTAVADALARLMRFPVLCVEELLALLEQLAEQLESLEQQQPQSAHFSSRGFVPPRATCATHTTASSPLPLANVRLLVVDSVASLLSPLLTKTSAHGHALMIQVARQLKTLALRFSLAVLVTNHSVNWTASSAQAPGSAGGTGVGEQASCDDIIVSASSSIAAGGATELGAASSPASALRARPALGVSWAAQPSVSLLLASTGAATTSASVGAESNVRVVTVTKCSWTARHQQCHIQLTGVGVADSPAELSLARTGSGRLRRV